MPDRRNFLRAAAGLPVIGSLIPRTAFGAARRDYFKELGVRPFINAAGTYTTLTASLMPPEVMAAINYASKRYVRLIELHDAVGARIASLIGCEAAMVSAGAASALTLGTAACITGKNQDFIHRLPDTEGMKNEVIFQKTHRFGYDHAIRNCGVKIVEVETAEELERAINPRTAMMFFLNFADPSGKIKMAEYVALGKKHNLPTFIDCAADVPPASRLSEYTRLGFDLVTFSGGKGLRGPQSAGLLVGRKDLIEAARLNASPFSDSIGRGMKVNKEELLGMLAAVERYTSLDHAAERRQWEKDIKLIADSVAGIRSVTIEPYEPEIANHVPHMRIRWDESVVKIAPVEVVRKLREGEPSIELTPSGRDHIALNTWMLEAGEARLVARRLREVLKGALAS